METDLKAVLFLNGPAEFQVFVLDITKQFHTYVHTIYGKCEYQISQSSIGPEGWVADLIRDRFGPASNWRR